MSDIYSSLVMDVAHDKILSRHPLIGRRVLNLTLIELAKNPNADKATLIKVVKNDCTGTYGGEIVQVLSEILWDVVIQATVSIVVSEILNWWHKIHPDKTVELATMLQDLSTEAQADLAKC